MTPCCSLCTPKQLECKGTACTTSKSLGMVASSRRFCTGNAFQVPVSSCSSIMSQRLNLNLNASDAGPHMLLPQSKAAGPRPLSPVQQRHWYPTCSSSASDSFELPAGPPGRALALGRTQPLAVGQRRGPALDSNFRRA